MFTLNFCISIESPVPPVISIVVLLSPVNVMVKLSIIIDLFIFVKVGWNGVITCVENGLAVIGST